MGYKKGSNPLIGTKTNCNGTNSNPLKIDYLGQLILTPPSIASCTYWKSVELERCCAAYVKVVQINKMLCLEFSLPWALSRKSKQWARPTSLFFHWGSYIKLPYSLTVPYVFIFPFMYDFNSPNFNCLHLTFLIFKLSFLSHNLF